MSGAYIFVWELRTKPSAGDKGPIALKGQNEEEKNPLCRRTQVSTMWESSSNSFLQSYDPGVQYFAVQAPS